MKIGRTVVGVDTAKRVYQLHWVETETGECLTSRHLGHLSLFLNGGSGSSENGTSYLKVPGSVSRKLND